MRKRILMTIAVVGSILCVGCSGAKDDKTVEHNTSTEYVAGEDMSNNGNNDETVDSSNDKPNVEGGESDETTTAPDVESITSSDEAESTTENETTSDVTENTTQNTTSTNTNSSEQTTTKPSGNTGVAGGSTSSQNKITMTTSQIELQEWSSVYLGWYVSNYSDNITWTTSDSSIAQVVDGNVYGVYPGTTTLKGTLDGTTVSATIKVTESSYSAVDINTDKITLFEGETYKLLATRKDAKFSSSNTSVATVGSDGTVKGVSAGSATITVTSGDKTAQCNVKIVKNDGTYYNSKLTTQYKVATERTVYVSNRIVMIVDAGTPIEDGILTKLESIMSTIESYTGLSYTNINSNISQFAPQGRVQINVISNGSAYGMSTGITIQPYDLAVSQNGVYPIVHELLHTIQLRNSVYVGNVLTEGFAVYFGEQIIDTLSYPITWDIAYSEYAWITGADITASNAEANLVSGDNKYEAGYLMVRYIVDNYGKSKITQLFSKITDAAKDRGDYTAPGAITSLSEQDILNIIKTNTASNLVSKFYTYAAGCGQTVVTTITDLTGMTRYYMTYTGHCQDDYWGICDRIKCDGSIIIDLTQAIDYAQKVYGRKYKGIYDGCMYDIIQGVTVTYYDAAGNVVEGQIINIEGYGEVMYAEGAVMAKYEGATEFDFQQDIRFQFDSEFSESLG